MFLINSLCQLKPQSPPQQSTHFLIIVFHFLPTPSSQTSCGSRSSIKLFFILRCPFFDNFLSFGTPLPPTLPTPLPIVYISFSLLLETYQAHPNMLWYPVLGALPSFVITSTYTEICNDTRSFWKTPDTIANILRPIFGPFPPFFF